MTTPSSCSAEGFGDRSVIFNCTCWTGLVPAEVLKWLEAEEPSCPGATAPPLLQLEAETKEAKGELLRSAPLAFFPLAA